MYKLAATFALMAAAAGPVFANCVKENWQRTGGKVFQDRIAGENYEVASDPHVLQVPGVGLRMIYSGDQDERISIKLAEGRSWLDWRPVRTLIGPDKGPRAATKKETPFYRQARNGKHQIYFIGYENEETYQSQIFLAEADNLEGPYTVRNNPVVPRGRIGGRNVYLITSPSVVEHEGTLYMLFLGWNGFENVTEVWTMAATSNDDGRTWGDFQVVNVPIGMEGQVTKRPDGGFVATRTGEVGNREGLFIACADHPLGPWQSFRNPAIVAQGQLEKDEIIAPQISFTAQGDPIMFYTGADHMKGWWVLQARPAN